MPISEHLVTSIAGCCGETPAKEHSVAQIFSRGRQHTTDSEPRCDRNCGTPHSDVPTSHPTLCHVPPLGLYQESLIGSPAGLPLCTHSTEKESGPTLGLVSPVYDSYQYFGIGHWTYTYKDRARGTRREDSVTCRVDLVHLVCFVHLVDLVQPNKRDKLNKPEQPAILAFHE